MEENKSTKKIRLSTFFLILAILVIIFMTCYIYVENKNFDREMDELETKTIELEKNINNLQQEIKKTTNTINSNASVGSNNSQANNTSDNKEFNFSDNEIKKSLQNYLDLVGRMEGSPLSMIEEIGLCNSGDYNNANRTEDNYVKTNIKYSDYKEKMLDYVTEEWLNTKFNRNYKEKDGILYFFDGGATGMEFEVKDITIKGDYSESSYIARVYNISLDGSKQLNNIEFHIANNNGKCVISYCD